MNHQPWQLTALALGELDEETAARLREQMKLQPELAREFDDIQQTLAQLQKHFQTTQSGLDSDRRNSVLQSIQSVKNSAHTPSAFIMPDVQGPNGRLGMPVRRWMTYAAMAACALVAIGFAVTNRMGRWMQVAQVVNPSQSHLTELQQSQTAVSSGPVEEFERPLQVGASSSPMILSPEPRSGVESKTAPFGDRLGSKSDRGGMGGADMYGMDMGGVMGGAAVYHDLAKRPSVELQSSATFQQKPERLSRMRAKVLSGALPSDKQKLNDSDSTSPPNSNEDFRERGRYFRNTEFDFMALDVEKESVLRGIAVEEGIDGLTEQKAIAAGERFAPIQDNEFQLVTNHPLSTFSIDVDTASFTKIRQYLLQANTLPRPDMVRIEELVNYFSYQYESPRDDQPFGSQMAVAQCPWASDHRLVRIALQAKKPQEKRLPTNLVFLIDVSGSMNEPNKLPLVKDSLRMLAERLTENDRVAIVVYAGAAGMVLPSTTGDQQATILQSLDRLSAGGSTNGGDGIRLAYKIAKDHFIGGGVNRVILCTDGDFNVGTTGTDELVRLVESEAKSNVFVTVLGYGMGNTNDDMMEQITNRGNGLYGFIDSPLEARRMMVEQMSGTLQTIAKDVKIQVEFNPMKVAAYRLIGYENRILAAEDFADDKKDAGEIGMGHAVTALYEIVPAKDDLAAPSEARDLAPLRYRKLPEMTPEARSDELLILKLRYKQPEGTASLLSEFPLRDSLAKLTECDRDFRWAASIAQFGMLLRKSPHAGNSDWPALIEAAEEAAGSDPDIYRKTALDMMRKAQELSAHK